MGMQFRQYKWSYLELEHMMNQYWKCVAIITVWAIRVVIIIRRLVTSLQLPSCMGLYRKRD